MKIEHVVNNKRYTLSNENLKDGDSVYSIGRGRINDNREFLLNKLDWRFFILDESKPDEFLGEEEPAKIVNLKYSDYKPYEVRTTYGFGPIESYYKIIKVEEKQTPEGREGSKIKPHPIWVEIK